MTTQSVSPEHFEVGRQHIVMGVTKMGNIVPKVGLEPTSLAFRASVLPLLHIAP